MKFNYYIGFNNKNQREGGSARNYAIKSQLMVGDCKGFLIYPGNSIYLLYKSIFLNLIIYLCKNNNIYINYTSIVLIGFGKKISYSVIGKKYISFILKYLTKRNNVFFEVNDLQYEQSIDLDLPLNPHYHIDEIVFKIDKANFIFSSVEMSNYVKHKYGSNGKHFVLVNGGPELIGEIGLNTVNSPLRFVYAGSLNPGRQIMEMINYFTYSKHILVLMGTGGEWIPSVIKDKNHIQYIGSLNEMDALIKVASCDCGLIPYDPDRLYYNLCFPTKASFYVAAGIPFLSTKTRELMNHFDESSSFFINMNEWPTFFERSDISKVILDKKIYISKIKHKYSWNYLINNLLNEINNYY